MCSPSVAEVTLVSDDVKQISFRWMDARRLLFGFLTERVGEGTSSILAQASSCLLKYKYSFCIANQGCIAIVCHLTENNCMDNVHQIGLFQFIVQGEAIHGHLLYNI